MELKGSIAVVTGGASGIGRALCHRFAAEGAQGIVVSDINEAGRRCRRGRGEGAGRAVRRRR